MSVPPDPPPLPPPDKSPVETTTHSKREMLNGALAATVVVVLSGPMFGIGSGIAPLLALAGVVLGSILTVFERTRRFAIGYLIASAILMVAMAGICMVLLWSP